MPTAVGSTLAPSPQTLAWGQREEVVQPPSAKFGYELAGKMQTWQVLVASFFSLGGFLAGILLIAAGFFALQMSSDSMQWQETTATITKCVVIARGGIRRQRTYNLQIDYTYSVNGQEFVGHRVDGAGQVGRDVRDIARRYPEGSVHPVYYDPNDPAQAVLEPGVSGSNLAWFGMGGMLLLGGLAGLVVTGLTLLHRLT